VRGSDAPTTARCRRSSPPLLWANRPKVSTVKRSACRSHTAFVHGSGSQTRRLCFVVVITEFFARLWRSYVEGSVELANPHLHPTLELDGRLQRKGGCWRRAVA
jgi:hypothetical protein